MAPSGPVRPLPWKYLGGDVVTLGQAGTVEVTTLPDRATIFEIRANGSNVYFEINAATASANSPGYIADGLIEVLGPLSNLAQLAVYLDAAGSAHLMFFREEGV